MFVFYILMPGIIISLTYIAIDLYTKLKDLELAVAYMGICPEDLINRSKNQQTIDFLLAEVEANQNKERKK